MKNLNNYGKEFVKKVKEGGRLEDIYDHYKVEKVSVTKSKTGYLINMYVVVYTEEIYVYKKKYKLDTHSKIACDEIFTIPFSSTAEEKKEMVENFIKNMYSNIFEYEVKEISEHEYNMFGDMSTEEIKTKIINSII